MPNALMIFERAERDAMPTLSDRGRDKINAQKLNKLQGPITAKMIGGHAWPIIDVEVECAIFRADICGLPQVMHFCEIVSLIDIDGREHDPEDFWN